MQKSLLALGIALFMGSTAVMADKNLVHPFHAAQAENAPNDVHMAVEIPAGSFTKYEINEEGLVFVDRFQSMPVVYPANYGSLPRTLGGDNDPLDGLVLTREALHPGVLIKFRPIGYLKMIDGGEADDAGCDVLVRRVRVRGLRGDPVAHRRAEAVAARAGAHALAPPALTPPPAQPDRRYRRCPS